MKRAALPPRSIEALASYTRSTNSATAIYDVDISRRSAQILAYAHVAE